MVGAWRRRVPVAAAVALLVVLAPCRPAEARVTRPLPRATVDRDGAAASVVSRPPAVTATTAVALHLRGGGHDAATLVTRAADWVGSLAAPASMVSGAVLSNLYQTLRPGSDLSLHPGDAAGVRAAKKLAHILLASAFAAMIGCIFLSFSTRAMLLALPAEALEEIRVDDSSTPLSVMYEHFELEYLTCRILVGQGLLNWLAALVLTFGMPRPSEPVSARKMNRFVSSVLIFVVLTMVSYFNRHTRFYPNYHTMVSRWLQLATGKFLWHWPPQPMAYAIGAVAVFALYLGVDAFLFDHDDGIVPSDVNRVASSKKK